MTKFKNEKNNKIKNSSVLLLVVGTNLENMEQQQFGKTPRPPPDVCRH